MAFHIPFEHRNRNRQNIGPVYIGFDQPAPPSRPRKKFNWWGFNGLWMSMASFVVAGFTSPLALLVSLVGLRRPGKKMAIAGTLFSLLGTGLAGSILYGVISHEHHQAYMAQVRKDRIQRTADVEETKSLLASATEELEEYRDSHDGSLPSWVDCNMLMLKYEDPWGKTLRFDATAESHGMLRSAGPDRVYETKDDLQVRVEGETERKVLLDLGNEEITE